MLAREDISSLSVCLRRTTIHETGVMSCRQEMTGLPTQLADNHHAREWLRSEINTSYVELHNNERLSESQCVNTAISILMVTD
jgi:hypothetical protein